MPETPDFDQIALRLATQHTAHAQVAIVEQLRLVWNARGAADAEVIDREAHRVYDEATRTGRTDLDIDLVTALKKLDR